MLEIKIEGFVLTESKIGVLLDSLKFERINFVHICKVCEVISLNCVWRNLYVDLNICIVTEVR